MTNTMIEFPDKDQMIDKITTLVLAHLENAILKNGRALFAVSGGSSPKPLYEKLSRQKFDWSKVDILLVDERWVDIDEAGSNETFINNTLLQNEAASANLMGLKNNALSPVEGLPALKQKISSLPDQIDVAVLGMGPDGHTASWFPHAENLDKALDIDSGEKFETIKAKKSAVTGDHLHRMTMTLPFLKQAKCPVLMISGAEKQQAFLKAVDLKTPLDDAPVKALVNHCPDLWVCWAP